MRKLPVHLLYSHTDEACRDGTIIDSTEAIVKHWGRYVLSPLLFMLDQLFLDCENSLQDLSIRGQSKFLIREAAFDCIIWTD